MLYEKIVDVSREYIGPVAPTFVDNILEQLSLDKNALNEGDLVKIAQMAYVKTKAFSSLAKPIQEDIKKDILALKAD